LADHSIVILRSELDSNPKLSQMAIVRMACDGIRSQVISIENRIHQEVAQLIETRKNKEMEFLKMKVESKGIRRKTFQARNKTRKRFPNRFQNISKYVQNGTQGIFMAQELEAHGFDTNINLDEDEDENGNYDSSNDNNDGSQQSSNQLVVSTNNQPTSLSRSLNDVISNFILPDPQLPPIFESTSSNASNTENVNNNIEQDDSNIQSRPSLSKSNDNESIEMINMISMDPSAEPLNS
jgi:hypothetical protein